jgi:hypothetical protein
MSRYSVSLEGAGRLSPEIMDEVDQSILGCVWDKMIT